MRVRALAQTQLLPWMVVCVFAAFLVISRMRFNTLKENYTAYRTRVTKGLRQDLIARDSALHVGDLLPSLPIESGSGEVAMLSDLPGRGYRFLYFYREDCPVCRAFSAGWQSLSPGSRARFAFIAYHNGFDLLPDLRDNSYAVKALSDHRAYALMKYVPALVTVRDDGRILSVGDGYPDFVRLIRLYGLLPDTLIPTLESIARVQQPE